MKARQALKAIKKMVRKGERIVFVSGNFNIVHPGHLRLLRFAAQCGDFLVVGVQADALTQLTLLPQALRLDGVQSTSWVKYAFLLSVPPEVFIRHLKPDFVVKGQEHENQYNPESAAVESYGGKLLFSSGEASFSSLDLLRDEFKNLNFSTIVKPKDFLIRHGFSLVDLRKTVGKMKGLRVVVIGETIVDEYITCDPLGMSQEDPTIAVTPIAKDRFVGGAGIVSAHARGFGADVHFFSVVGKDEPSDFVRHCLKKYGVNAHIYEDESRPTIRKERFRAHGKTLLRVNHFHQHPINQGIQKKIIRNLSDILNDTKLLIFSDFNYGCLPQPLVDEIIALCQAKDVMIVADSQASSQIGYVSRFHDALLLTPTEREARISVGDFNAGLVVLAEMLRTKARAQNILLTLGAEGLLIHAPSASPKESVTDRLPAMNASPKDVSGAGDSLLTCASMAIAVGADIWQAAYLGSIAAACQLSRIGNIPLTVNELMMEIKS
ncbi:MAG: adenylyltransferase/cytidyltransferase family protein [Candidatus Omnitrophica bacterium]|nr:adenylyltransferase/cytidyltransferase family protein [Candidatus Omnitrophota bacterium]